MSPSLFVELERLSFLQLWSGSLKPFIPKQVQKTIPKHSVHFLELSGVRRLFNLSFNMLFYFLVICALPWFFLKKRCLGLDLPPGTTLLTVGFKRAYVAFRECMRLKQTFTYLIFYFLVQVTPTASHATFSCSIYS